MLSFKQFIKEHPQVKKNSWTFLSSHDDETAHELIDLVGSAYKHTTLGSFVNTITDVKNSDWLVLDWNHDPKLDVAVFYRQARQNEKWLGKKIQGLGHNSEIESKKKVLEKLVDLLNGTGWWIEASDALAISLLKRLEPVTNKELIKTVFGQIEQFNSDGSYVRIINNKLHTEYLFGDIKLK